MASNLHPLVLQTRELIEGREPDEKYGRIVTTLRDKSLRVRVTPRLVPQALGLLDKLIKRLQERGFGFEVEERVHDWGHGRHVQYYANALLNGMQVELGVEERTTGYELSFAERNKRTDFWTTREYRAHGKLTVCADSYWAGTREWNPISGKPIEDRIDEIIDGLIELSAKAKKAKLKRQAEVAMDRRKEEFRDRQRRAKEAEKQKIQDLMSQMNAWETRERLLKFISARKAEGAEESWVNWAGSYANSLYSK